MSNPANQQDTLVQLKRALAALKDLRAKLETVEQSRSEPIAIIGMGCRFPGGADSPAAFWELLKNGVDAVAEIPADRWDADALYDPDFMASGKTNTRWGGFLNRVAEFDAGFFGISPREASYMDPQQRLLLEIAYEALEEAGQGLESLAGSQTGVFVGIHSHSSDYAWMQLHDLSMIDQHTGTGTAHSIVANRLSYVFDLRGPSLAVDTACSSALIAVHLACRSLRDRECSMALAGGVNLILSPEATVAFSKLQMMAADGHCKTFDAAADGFVRGEGGGLLVLKRLSDALAAGDRVLAVIQGSAVNQDGRTNGLTAPNGPAQEAVIRQALANAQLNPADITYVETHGTGTALGDPIEVEALANVIGRADPSAAPCLLGSVKANIGHLEGAAGIAGIIKTVLALQHELIPPQVHFYRLNPHISLAETRFAIPVEPQPWPANGKPRYAAVSSFGFGGTNGHFILGEAPPLADQRAHGALASESQPYLLPLSARSGEALRDLARRYQTFLAETDASLADICYSASLRRSHLERRAAVVARSPEELRAALAAVAAGEAHADVVMGSNGSAEPRGVVFVFSGQGAQWAGMGRELAATEPVFRAAIDECDRLLREQGANWSLLEELAAGPDRSRLDETALAQPAIFALQVALAALWRAWGIEPDAVTGHSVGEVAAAYVAGVVTLPDAVRIVLHRGREMQKATGQGKMAAIGLSQANTAALLSPYDGRLSIAAVNSPISTVVAGEPEAVAELVRVVAGQGFFARLLPVDYAFHSAQMEPFRPALVRALTGLAPAPAAIPIYSTVTGARVNGSELDAAYWGRNIREPVQFAAAMAALEADGFGTFVEVSPHPVLGVPVAQCLRSPQPVIVPSLQREQGERQLMLRSLGTLYAEGYRVDWRSLYPAGGRFVSLPTYPWQRDVYWLPSAGRAASRGSGRTHPAVSGGQLHPLLQQRLRSPIPSFESQLDQSSVPAWAQHRLHNATLLAATAYLEMACAAAATLWSTDEIGPLCVEEMEIRSPLILHASPRTVHVTLAQDSPGQARFQVFSLDDEAEDEWRLHASGRVCPVSGDTALPGVAVDEIRARCHEQPPAAYAERLRAGGLHFASDLPGFARLWQGEGEALGEFEPGQPPGEQEPGWVMLHTGHVEEGVQLLLATALTSGRLEPTCPGYLLAAVDRCSVHATTGVPSWMAITFQELQPAGMKADLRLLDSSGRPLTELLGLRFEPLDRSQLPAADVGDWLYDVVWQPQPHSDAAPDTATGRQAEAGTWILFSDGIGIGQQLAEQLQRRGDTCQVVLPGATFEASDDGHFRIDPAAPEHFTRLFSLAAPVASRPLRGVVYLWGLDAVSTLESDELPSWLHGRACEAPLYLVQALLQRAQQAGVPPEGENLARLWLVTQGAQALGASALAPSAVAQAPLWGLGRVIALEHPEVWGGLIDLGLEEWPDAGAVLAAEMAAPDGEDQIAYRQGSRYVARLVPSARGGTTGDHARIDPNGVYLITGGLGELGLQVANWLAEKGARHLILTSRSGLPDRAEWQGVPVDSGMGRRIAAVRRLEEQGLTVTVAKTDAGNRAQMAALFDRIAQTQPALKGVIHCAGTVAYRPVAQLDRQLVGETLASKAAGAWLLHELTRGLELDFMVYFSSGAAVWGSAGMGHYAAANHVLDLLAHYRHGLGLPALSINWGWWADGGIATAELEQYFGQIGVAAMASEQALNVLDRLMGDGAVQKTVAAVDWQRFKPIYEAKRRRPLLEHMGQGAPAPAEESAPRLIQQLETAAPEERFALLLEYVRGEAATILGFSSAGQVDLHQGFFKMGMNSLMTVQLRTRLEASLHCSLPSTIAFEYPTIHALTGYLAGKLLGIAPGDRAAAPQPEAAKSGPAADLEALSQDELLSLFDRELAAANELVERDPR